MAIKPAGQDSARAKARSEPLQYRSVRREKPVLSRLSCCWFSDKDVTQMIGRSSSHGSYSGTIKGSAKQDDSGYLGKPHGPGCLKPAMACNDSAVGVREYRIGESERFNGSSKLFNLALWMRRALRGSGMRSPTAR
jgi:hypothetical protein